MNLSDNVKELKELNKEIKALNNKKYKVEQEILKELDNFQVSDKARHIEIDDIVTIGVLYKNKIDEEKLKQNYPTLYEQGLSTIFSYKQALLCFDNKKDFWNVMKDCIVKEKVYKTKPKKKKYLGK